MDSITEKKAALRKAVLSRRASLDPAVQAAGSIKIHERLQALPQWRECVFPCLYIGSKPGEVATLDLLREALDQGKQVCVPVIEPESGRLFLAEVKDPDNLVPGHFGILEPSGAELHQPGALAWDLAVVPGVAFDRQGHRIGFGKGYYDCLLSARQTPRIALAFSFQIVEEIPTSPHDIDMDLVLTENETIQPAR